MPDCTEVFKSFFKCGTELKLGGGFSPVVPNLEGPKMIKGMRQKWHKIPGFSQIFAFFLRITDSHFRASKNSFKCNNIRRKTFTLWLKCLLRHWFVLSQTGWEPLVLLELNLLRSSIWLPGLRGLSVKYSV